MSAGRLLGLTAVLVLVAGSARAGTITFNGVPAPAFPPNPTVVLTQDGGFDFSSNHHHDIFVPAACGFGGCPDNGTPYIGEEDGDLGDDITMSRTGGGTFSLLGLDVSEAFLNASAAAAFGLPNADLLLITASNGSAFQTPLDGVAGFQTLSGLIGFEDVTWVTFSGLRFAGGGGGINLDNIVVADRVVIPEPSSAVLFGTAWLAAGIARRRRS